MDLEMYSSPRLLDGPFNKITQYPIGSHTSRSPQQMFVKPRLDYT